MMQKLVILRKVASPPAINYILSFPLLILAYWQVQRILKL